MKNQKNLTLALEGSLLRGIFAVAFPIILGNILQSSYQFVDAYWVGKLGQEAVAAVSVSGPILFLVIALATGFAMAGSILIAQYAGAKNQQMVNYTAAQTLTTIVMVSLIFSGLGIFFSKNILELMGVAPNVLVEAVGYMQITFLGLIFIFLFSMIQSIFRGVGEVRLPMKIILMTALVNIILDPIFIFGWGPIEGGGIRGAAIATLFSQFLATIVGFWVLFRGKYGVQLQKTDFFPDRAFIKKVFFLGVPSSLEMSVRAFGMVILMSLVASFGTAAVAAFGAGGNIFQLIMIPTIGLSVAISTIVGQNIGASQLDRAEKVAKMGALIAFLLLEILGILIFLFAPQLIAIFIHNDENVVRIGADFLRILSPTLGFMGVQFAMNGVFRASGNMKLTLILAIITIFVVQVPLAYLLSNWQENISGVWWSYVATNVIMMGISCGIFSQGKWKTKKITETEKSQKRVMQKSLPMFGRKK